MNRCAGTLHSQIEVEGALSAGTSREDAVDSASQLVTDSALYESSASATAISISAEKRLRAQTPAEIQDDQVHRDPSISNTPTGISMEKPSTAPRSDENTTMEDGSRTQALKMGTRMRAPANPRNLTTSGTCAIAGSFVTAAHSIQPMETTAPIVGARGEPWAQSFASAHTAQPGLPASLESTERAEKAIETFTAIDAQEHGPTSQWTLSGSHRAEAGFQDPVTRLDKRACAIGRGGHPRRRGSRVGRCRTGAEHASRRLECSHDAPLRTSESCDIGVSRFRVEWPGCRGTFGSA